MGPSGCFTHVIVILMFGTSYMQVLYLGRAPRTKETLLDFREKCRVTRHSRVFCGLTGSQRTPGDWGVRISSFGLTNGMEAIIPTEIRMPTIRAEIPEKANAKAITNDLNIIDELQEAVAVCIASYQQRLENLHNRRIKLCTFLSRDLVLRRGL